MLEGLAARLLNSLLGKYVQEFDAEGLNVGIFSGNVSLRDLKLKPSCLHELELPVEVVSGVIGELTLTIPWNSLSARPIQITIEDLFVVAHPVGLLAFDEAREKELTRALKRRAVERVESCAAVATLQGLVDSLVPLLSHTVQLRVRNIHVRYEDPRHSLAAGFFVQEFSVETTNSKWKPVSQQSGNCSYQLVRVEALSVYLNAGLDASQLIIQDAAWVQHMRTALLQFQVKGAPLDFVVKPLNAKLKVILGRGEQVNVAPLLVDVVIQDAVIVLSHRQLNAALAAADLFSRISLYRGYLALRPGVPVKGHGAEWWRYAYAAALQQRVRPYTWAKLMALRKSYREYKELYKQTVLKSGDLELRLDLQRVEDSLPVTCVVIAREHAKLELRVENDGVVELEEVPAGSGQYRMQIQRPKPSDSEAPAFIEHKLNVTVDNVSVSLVRDGREVLCVGFTQCLTSLQVHRHHSWKLSARAGNVLVEGASPDSELVPLLSSPVNAHTGNSPYTCFSLDVEKKPQPQCEAADHEISITVMPMELIYQEHAFSELLTWAPNLDWGWFWRELTGPSCGRVATDTTWDDSLLTFWRLATGIDSSDHYWSLGPRWDVRASIALPRLVLPEAGTLQKSGLVVVVDLGKWEVETELQPPLTMEEVGEMTQMELEERLYHRLLVQCSDIQVLFTDSGEEWRDLARRDESDAHVVSRARGSIALSLSIKPEYRLLPRLKLNVGVPAIHANLSERRTQQLLDVLETMPRPSARYVMFTPAPPLDPLDRVPTDPAVPQLAQLAYQMVALELSRQRTPDSLASPIAPLGVMGVMEEIAMSVRSVMSDTSASDEELELWARTLDLPGFEDNVSPHNTITALVRVTLGELVLHLPRSLGFQEKPYLMVRVARISLDLALMQFGPAVQAAVGGFQLIDKLHIGPSGEYLEVVNTYSDLDLLTLLYRKVRADCPDFKSHFHGVEQSLVVDVGQLSLVLQREACQAILKFLQDARKRIMERPLWDQLPESWRVRLEAPLKSMREWVLGDGGDSKDPPVPPGGTKYSYSAHMAQLRVRLREADLDLLELQAGGLEGDWALRANERLVGRFSLQKLSMEDVGDTTLYPHILTQDEDHVVEVKLVRLSPGARHGLAHATLRVSLGRLHFVLASHVLHTVQRFGEWPRSVGRLWKGCFRSSPFECGALQLSLTLHLPTVLLPPGPTAPALLILNLGDLTVENFLKEDGAGTLLDNILIRLENAFVTRGLMTLAGSVESREEVVEPLRVTLDVKRVLTGVPMVDVAATVDAVRVAIGQRDLALILDVYSSSSSLTSFFDIGSVWQKGQEPVELRSLEAFLRDGHSRRRDSTIRCSVDSFILTLYKDMDEHLSSPVRDLTHALCKLHLQDAIVNVETRASGVCELRLSIHSCVLDDVRPDPAVVITRVFGARPGGDRRLDSAISVSSPPLVDVVGKQSERGDRCVDVLVEKTRLSLSASFVAALVRFLAEAAPDRRDGGCDNLGYVGDTLPKSKPEASSCSDHVHDAPDSRRRGLSVSLQWRRPEVALLASGGVGLVTRCELLVDYSRCPGRDEMVLRLAGLRVNSVQPAPTVMRPCDVEMVRNVTNGGVHVTVAVGPMDFTLCSAVFAACTTMVEELVAALRDHRERSPTPLVYMMQADDLWTAKKIAACCEPALCGALTEALPSEPHSFPAGSPAESLTVSVGKISVVLGIQDGVVCSPLFVSKAFIKLQASDWSSSPTFTGDAQIEVASWSDDLQTWEPFVEPWSWTVELYQSKALPISPCAARPPRSRRSQDRPVQPPANSDSSGDESEPGMTFLRPDHFHLGRGARPPTESLADCSDSEADSGALERMRGAVAHLFVGEGDSSGGDASSEEVETESASSDTCRSPATERAVFLNKHADSVDSGLETEAVDRQATHVLIRAGHLEVTVTPHTLSALQLLQSQRLSATPRTLNNHLGPGAVVTLIQEGAVVATSCFEEESPPSTPGSASPCPSPSRDSSTSGDSGRVSPDLTFPREGLPELKSRACSAQLLVKIPGLDDVTLPLGRAVGIQGYPLTPARHGRQYTVTVETCRTGSITHYTVAAPLKVKNETSYAIGVYYKKSVLIALGETAVGESPNPFDDMVRLAVVAPDDCFHVPLTVCYHCKLHFLPVHPSNYSVSDEGISWQEMKTTPDTFRDVMCPAATDGTPFCLKICWGEMVGPQRVIRITTPWVVQNVLPCACELVYPSNQRVRLEAGEETSVYSINPQHASSIAIEVPEYMGQPWTGTLSLTPDCNEKTVPMATDHDTDGGNKQLAISVLVARDAAATILLYAPYWLINKTGLTLQVRGSGSDVVQEWGGAGPLLFCYRKPRARTVRLRVLTSSWSSAFSLDPVGCSGLVVCRDRERRKKYRVVVQCEPSHVHPSLCRVITFLPHLLVENACKKHLQFMEDNERADLWHDIAPGQCLPFWPDTDLLRMVVRLRDSKHVSPPFPMARPHVTALRMDKGCSLTVDVSGGEGTPLRVLLRPYRPGDAPVRIDNHCADLFLKLRQKDCPQVALLSPYHSLLYTWDDACKERELLWSVYNNAGREVKVPLLRDASGEDRISFRSVRVRSAKPPKPHSPSSSPSSDSDPEPSTTTTVLKETRKDTVVVYWSSFLQGPQRVLLLTQDEGLARRARRAIDAERTNLELFVSLSGCGLSLCSPDVDGIVRELAYCSLPSAPARWELCVAQRWKPLPPELAAWLENNYTHRQLQPTIKDYIHVDLCKMQMSKPLFGLLRRRQRSALWLQYRVSPHWGVLRGHVHRIQVDDQRLIAPAPCVLIAGSSAGHRPAAEAAILWRHGAAGEVVIKFLSLDIAEHRVHLDMDWLSEMSALARRLRWREDAHTAMRRDIARLHSHTRTNASGSQITETEEGHDELIIATEHLHYGELSLDITLVPSSSTPLAISSATTPWPVPNVLVGLLNAVAAAPAPIANLPIKLSGMDVTGGCSTWTGMRNALLAHYRTQLLQQLHVLLLGVHVLATPTARLAIRTAPAQEGAVFPEEFSDTVWLEAEARTRQSTAGPVDGAAPAEAGVPRDVWTASRSFPLGCALGLSGLAVSVARGPPCPGLDAFSRGPGRAVAGLMTALQGEPGKGLPDALGMLNDAVSRCGATGGNVVCRARPPRYANPIMGVRPFSMVEAQGLALVETISRGRYCKDVYWAHAPLTPTHSSVLLITLQRVLLAEQVGNSLQLNVTWSSTWDTVQSVKTATKQSPSLVFTIQQGVEISERQICCSDLEVLTWLHARVQEAILLPS